MTQPTSIRTFRVASPLKTLTPLILTAIFTVGLIYVISEPDARFAVWIVAAVLAFSVVFAYYLLSRTRLEVSSDGITYYAIGFRVRSTWDNLEGYGKRVLGAQSVESLILRKPGIEVSRWMQIGYNLMPAAQVAAAAQGRYLPSSRLSSYADVIPVALYSENWRSSELGALIKQYAPQAFDNLIAH